MISGCGKWQQNRRDGDKCKDMFFHVIQWVWIRVTQKDVLSWTRIYVRYSNETKVGIERFAASRSRRSVTAFVRVDSPRAVSAK